METEREALWMVMLVCKEKGIIKTQIEKQKDRSYVVAWQRHSAGLD